MYVEITIVGLFSFFLGVVVGWNGYRKLKIQGGEN